jgi:GH35 family endo-1,4-beta-xylanase
MRTSIAGFVALSVVASTTVLAGFAPDRSVMSERYWKVWTPEALAKMDADIERYRKADASVEVPVPDGAAVVVEQIAHAFFFGAHIFNFDQLGSKERNDRYKALYSSRIEPGVSLFNSATVAFYWRTFERFPGRPRFEAAAEDAESFWNGCGDPTRQPHWRRPPTDPVVAYLESRGVRMHGHPLVWGNNAWMTPTWPWDRFCPESEKRALEAATGVKVPVWDVSLPAGLKNVREREWKKAWRAIYGKLGGEEIARLVPSYLKAQNDFYERRIREIAARYGSRVDAWDVVNESATDYRRFGERSVRNRPFDGSHYGPMPADYAFKAFRWAGKYLPKTAWFNLNDYASNALVARQAKDLMAHGARIDSIGSQMHLFNPKESLKIMAGEGPKHLTPDGVAARFRDASAAGLPIILSEITITAPDLTPRGQMAQAIIMRNMYRAWFAVEKMIGITWWNVVDGCGAPGEPSMSGLFTRDMKPKTAYYAMDDLVNREWRTVTSARARGGRVAFRGFRGRYRLSWKDADGVERSKVVEVK